MSQRLVIAVALACAVALSLAACGRRGALERPPQPEGQAGKAGEAAVGVPNRPFILDRLIR